MGTTIDSKIVEMKFDNRQFEQSAQKSLNTLDNLKKSLNFSDVSKSFESIEESSKKVNMSLLSNAVDTVSVRFSAMSAVALTALQNITNSVINTGKQMLRSLTVAPISQGFSEYELKLGSVQTIMASTGASLEEVNGYLKELNEYSDKTIYSFADMTQNIGKFTNAGVKLEDAVKAIQGVSNVAAVSGANANEASRAMYNFAQALSAGYVKLIDWKSIENANMATVEFKTQLLESAVAVGTLTKTADGMYQTLEGNTLNATKNFNETLQDQWLTTEVLVGTLNEYSDETTEIGKKAFAAAQDVKTFSQLMDTLKEAVGSGWAETWEIVFGDFEEAKALWTGVNNVVSEFIANQAAARNTMLQEWADLGGKSALIESFKNALEALLSVVKPIGKAFRDIFPKTTGAQLTAFSEKLKEITSKLVLGEEASDNLRNTFRGLFSVVKLVKDIFFSLAKSLSPLLNILGTLGGAILHVTGAIGSWVSSLASVIEETGALSFIAEKISWFITATTEVVKKFIGTLKEKFSAPGFEIFTNLMDRIKDRMSQVKESAISLKDGLVEIFNSIGDAIANSKFVQVLQALWNAVQRIVGGVLNAAQGLFGGIASKLGDSDFSGVIDTLNGISFSAIAIAITKFVKGTKEALDDLGGIKDNIVGILDSVRDCFKAYQEQIKAETLKKIATAVGILAAAIVAISLVDSAKLAASLGAITVLFGELLGSLSIFGHITKNINGVTKSSAAIIAMSSAVLVLSFALNKVASIDTKKLVSSVAGVGALMAMVTVMAKAMATEGKSVIKGATQMVIFASAVTVLASACKKMSTLDWKQLAIGLTGVGVLLTEISLFLKTAKFSGKTIATATGIVILSSAMLILQNACQRFATLNVKQLIKSIGSIGLLLGELALFTNLTGKAKHVVKTGVSLIAIAGALTILSGALKSFGSLNVNEIKMGLIALAGSLTAITAAVNLMPKHMVGIGVGLIAVGSALMLVQKSLYSMGGMPIKEIAKGLIALGGSMGILATGLNFMRGTTLASAALLTASAALLVLTPVLKILGGMSWSSIAKGLATLAGSLGLIGGAGAILAPVIPAILGLAGSFTLIGGGILALGAGLLAAGAGLSAVAGGLTLLAASGAASATAIVASLSAIITGVIGLIPAIAKQIANGFIDFAGVIAEGAPIIAKAVKEVVLSTIDVLNDCVPEIVEGLLSMLSSAMKSLATHIPEIVSHALELVIGVLQGIADNLPKLVKVAVDVIMAFFTGVVDAMKGIDVNVLLKGIAGVGLLSAIMVGLSSVAGLVPGAMLGVLGMGAVVAEMGLLIAAFGALSKIPGVNWLIEGGGELLQGIGTAIGKFVGGIVGGLMGGITSQFPKIGTDLSMFMQNLTPFIEGANGITAASMEGVRSLADVILILTATDILQGLTSWLTGGSSLASFAEDLVPFGTAMKQFSNEIAGMDGNLVANAATAGKTLAEMAKTLPNSGGVLGFFTGENDMDEFAAQLVPFGRAIVGFANSVEGLDAESVTNAATAGKAMAEMAKTLPNSGGVLGFFAGENDMDEFGAQLIPFGRAMMGFSKAVSGLDAAVIQESVTAGKALSELARTLPNSGGVLGFFSGENDIDDFGRKLVPFGMGMKRYSQAVAGIDTNAVVNSATAGGALSELANSLPNSGGIFSWFTGNNDMSAFGEQLISFGSNFARYADYIRNVDANTLVATSSAAGSIVELQNSIPKSGGWFSGDVSLSDFGKDMANFGYYLSEYSSNISGVNVALVSSVTSEIHSLIGVLSSMSQVNSEAASGFSAALRSIGNSGINEFMKAFEGSTSKVTHSVNTLLRSFVDSVKAGAPIVRASFGMIFKDVLTEIRSKENSFTLEGRILANSYANGIRDRSSYVGSAVEAVVLLSISSLRQSYYEFQRTGQYLVEGFTDGINSNAYLARNASAAMARAAARAAAKELDEHSPSKVGYKIGDYFGVAFVNAISDYADRSYESGSEIAKSAKDGLNNAINGISRIVDDEMNLSPTIKPVVDLSNVRSNAKAISSMLSADKAVAISSDIRETEKASRSASRTVSEPISNVVSFTQNNYSPKALSRLDIYRQTNNQIKKLKTMKGLK